MSRVLTVGAVACLLGLATVVMAAAATLSATFDGSPATPKPMDPADFEVIRLGMWTDDPVGAMSARVQHGPNCESPGNGGATRHPVSNYDEIVFQCRDHLMTSVVGQVAAIYMTPNQLLDLSSGSGTVKWDVSTASLSTRDWISVFIQGWDRQEQRILDEPIPGHQSNPRLALQIEQGGTGPAFESGSGMWHIEWYDENRNLTGLINDGCCGASVNKVTPMSAAVRTTFQLDITPGHARLWLPQFNYTLAEGNMPQIPWQAGIVTFAHHSYSPDKGYNPACQAGLIGPCDETRGEANTWHWDNLSISPSTPFTIIKADHRSTRQGDTFTFARPAPSKALLRFEAWGDAVSVSFDGNPAVAATRTGAYLYGEQSSSFVVPVPEGTTRATFTVKRSWCCAEVANPHIFALNGGIAPVELSLGDASVLGSVPGPGSTALLVVGNGTRTADLVAALQRAGCPSPTVAIIDNREWDIYIASAPTQVNASFPSALSGNTPFFVRCGF